MAIRRKEQRRTQEKKWLCFWPGILLFCLLVIGWARHALAQSEGRELRVKILAINDFHGHLSKDGLHDRKGSAPVLAAYLEAAAQGWEGRTFLVHAGDQVGGSPAASALLNEEPSITFLNILADRPGWSLIGTLGNHEFDQGKEALLRLIHRTCKFGRSFETPHSGARFPYVCANVVSRETEQHLLPPFVTRTVEGIPLAFIGAVTTEAPQKISRSTAADLSFQDEAAAINEQVALLRQWGVRSIIVLLHEGGCGQPRFPGKTLPGGDDRVRGRIIDIVKKLDDEVDVVVSGHTHKFFNVLLENKNHKKILVTQAVWHGEAFADIELTIDRGSKDVMAKWAQIKTTDWHTGSGLTPAVRVSQLVDKAQQEAKNKVKQMLGRDIRDPVGRAREEIPNRSNKTGESPLGNLVADAYRQAGGTQFALVNPGSIRAENILPGEVNWGELFCVQPFGNRLVRMHLTGQEIIEVLQQQWDKGRSPKFLQVSGLKYTYTNSPAGEITLSEDTDNPTPIKKDVSYTVTVNKFLADGGDNFTQFREKSGELLNVTDFIALINYIEKKNQQPLKKTEGRITKIDMKQ